jgi:predicted DNA-binding transcriptional regulator AlpA
MGERLLNTEDVLQRIGFGKTWLEERIAEGAFPKPIHKWRRNKWREKDVDDWIIDNYADRREGPPRPEESRVSH